MIFRNHGFHCRWRARGPVEDGRPAGHLHGDAQQNRDGRARNGPHPNVHGQARKEGIPSRVS